MSKDVEAALDACLNQLKTMESLQTCLPADPLLAAQLAPLLKTAAKLKTLADLEPPVPTRLQAGRARLLGEAVRLRSEADGRARSGLGLRLRPLLQRSVVTVVLAAALAMLALGSGTIAAAAKSLPGDTLYPVKRMTEGLQLALTLNQESRYQLMAKFDERRRVEARAVAGSERTTDLAFRGLVESTSVDPWLVSGVPVYVSALTHLDPGVDVGATVQVQARSLRDGRLWAMRITLEPRQVQPTLTPTAPPAPSSTPSPTVTATPVPEAPAQLPPPPTATVLPTVQPAATRTAMPTAVPPTPTPLREVKVRFRGRIESMDGALWTINGELVQVTAATRILDQDAPASVGVMATVLATRLEDGHLLALEITTERPAPAEEPFEFRGLIESVGPAQWVVSGRVVLIDAGTTIEGSPQPGLLAEVKALRRADGSLRAQRISVLLPTAVVQFEGTIEAFSASEWIVDGVVVRFDAQSALAGEPCLGCHAEIQGLLLPDGAVLARQIRVQAAATATPGVGQTVPTAPPAVSVPLAVQPDSGTPPTGPAAEPGGAADLRRSNPVEARAIEFRGLIQEIQERYWVVSGRVVMITEDSRVQGSPQIGALAEVKGLSMFGDVVLATSIEVALPGAYDHVDLEGVLESVEGTEWVVGGVIVALSPVTSIEGTPALGLVVEVHGVLHPDGSVLAERIEIRGPASAPQIDIAGRVEYIGPTQWTVAGTAVFLDERTLIDDSRAPAEAGMWAQVRARRGREGFLLAVRIRLSRPE